ncbi:universal stress protein [Hymenobacter aerilatus]|uniref:Universal stress protein n=1 Tax=Hymenobacter aerilatus TaxID=2932251 RepID=A0A8T9SU69_9BACT|nr:universal stress protein [Hymenobacter aerilatus]UOR03760.1 universal stress protein [Hymenobacter aerilatus]
MHLLVLTDFSPAADQALAYADALAVQLHATLVLLHVQRTSILDSEALTGSLSPLSEGEIAAALLQRRNGLSAPVVTEATVARVAEAATAAVQRYQPVLLLLGRPAATADSPEVVGHTTALKLLGHLPCPLLIVPEKASAPMPPQCVAIAADNQPFTLFPQAEPVVAWLHRLPAQYTIVHVAEPEDNDSAVVACRQVMASGLLPATAHPRHHGVRHLSVADGIAQGVQETEAELLVAQVHRHTWLGDLFHHSVTARLVQRATLPVLLLPINGSSSIIG